MTSRVLPPVAFGLALFLAWQAIVVVLQIPEYLLPSPAAILATVDRSLGLDFAVTFSEALAGFTIASVLAFAVATLFVRFHTLEQGIFPIAIAVKTTPIVAIAPLLVIWLGTGWWSKIVAAILICFFPVLVNTVKGLKAADMEYRELFETMGATRAQEFRKLRVPYCLPYLFSALKISSSLAVVGAIVGEFVGDQGTWLSDHDFFGAFGNGDAVLGNLCRGRRRDRDVLRHQLHRTPLDLLVERGG
jgi:NitT/TauT family transport system permease protein